jgi:Ni/Co efflux regulator RcnB
VGEGHDAEDGAHKDSIHAAASRRVKMARKHKRGKKESEPKNDGIKVTTWNKGTQTLMTKKMR